MNRLKAMYVVEIITWGTCVMWWINSQACQLFSQLNRVTDLMKEMRISGRFPSVTSPWSWAWEAKIGRKSLLLVVGCIISFQLALVHFESLQNLSTAKWFKYLFCTTAKIHIMTGVVKKQYKFLFKTIFSPVAP